MSFSTVNKVDVKKVKDGHGEKSYIYCETIAKNRVNPNPCIYCFSEKRIIIITYNNFMLNLLTKISSSSQLKYNNSPATCIDSCFQKALCFCGNVQLALTFLYLTSGATNSHCHWECENKTTGFGH